jgi:hypothetical protein
VFDRLLAHGFEIQFVSHARAIMGVDFPDAAHELEEALLNATIPIEEIVAGGGGEAKGTQRLRRALNEKGWRKTIFRVEKRINGIPKESQSHEIDHVRDFGNTDHLLRIALEIEWNNKDPFFDRDLENFKRLHADGAISMGIIVTRGRSLQTNLRALIKRFLDERQIRNIADLRNWRYEPTSRQRGAIDQRMTRKNRPLTFSDAFTDVFVSDKFGEATTHWRKLEDRVSRGVGNPCPLILIGLPDSVVTFHEGAAALEQLSRDEIDDGAPGQ